MATKQDELSYKTKELERKVNGMQRQLNVVNAKYEAITNKQERRIRDLEIKTAVNSGVSQRKVAEIYELSPGRVNQIVRKVS